MLVGLGVSSFCESWEDRPFYLHSSRSSSSDYPQLCFKSNKSCFWRYFCPAYELETCQFSIYSEYCFPYIMNIVVGQLFYERHRFSENFHQSITGTLQKKKNHKVKVPLKFLVPSKIIVKKCQFHSQNSTKSDFPLLSM